jgi:hypothetical protein
MKGKLKIIISSFAAASVLVSLGLFFSVPENTAATGPQYNTVDMSAVSVPELPAVKDARIDSALNQVLSNNSNGIAGTFDQSVAAQKDPLDPQNLRVVVEVKPTYSPITRKNAMMGEPRETLEEAIANSMTQVRAEIQRLGGTIHSARRQITACTVNAQTLEVLAKMPEVQSIRRAIKLRPEVTTEGVANIGADLYHDLPPYKTNPSKVMILDSGFENYQQVLGTELPATVTTRSFKDSGDIEAGGIHGTACAEIIYDIAGDIDMYLANISYDYQVEDALNWAIEKDIDIISYSLGNYFFPGDGTGTMEYLVSNAKQQGVTFATSAGNSGIDHWSGNFSDPDEDGWHNFAGEDELLEFEASVYMSTTYGVEAVLKWYDWGTWTPANGFSGATQDFDVYLFIWDGAEWQLLDVSDSRQPGYKWPYENTSLWYSTAHTHWGVAIKKHQATENSFLDLYIPVHSGDSLEYKVEAGSLTSPSDAPSVIAVGAVDAVGNYLHDYSSRGPTIDGRLKPEICAPSGVSTSGSAYGLLINGGFSGTSAACPHFVGAVALLKSKTPFTVDEIIQILYARSIDMGDAGWDNTYGRGRLNLRR